LSRNDKITIVMATYQQAHFLRTALLSCFNQTYDNYEVIVVSVMGDKETEAVLPSLPFPFVWIVSEKADYVHQRNIGIKSARGEYITLFDSDDYMLCNKLTCEIEVAKSQNALIVSSAFFVTDENLNIKSAVIPPEFSRERLLRGCMITDSCLVHRNIYNEFGLFDESYGECAFYEKWLRVAEKYPDKIKVNKTPVFLYRNYPKQMHRTLNKQWQMTMRQKVKQESLARKPLK